MNIEGLCNTINHKGVDINNEEVLQKLDECVRARTIHNTASLLIKVEHEFNQGKGSEGVVGQKRKDLK